MTHGEGPLSGNYIIGEVVHIKDNQLTLKSGESRLVVQRDRVADILTGGEGETKQ